MSDDGTLKAGLVVLVHPFESGASLAGDILGQAVSILARHDIPHVPVMQPVSDKVSARNAAILFSRERVNAIIVRLATWCDDTLLLELLDHHDVPVISWAHRDIDAGSLCGAQQFNMVLTELGKVSSIVVGTGDAAAVQVKNHLIHLSPVVPSRVPSLPAGINELRDGLRHLVVGIIGARTQGMLEVAFDEFSIKEVLGPSVVSVSMDELKARAASIDDAVASAAIASFRHVHPAITVAVPGDTLLNAFKIHAALENLVAQRGLGALAIECYPRYMGIACVSFALLADRGITCACEGDVHSAILAWIMQHVSGAPVNHVDVLDMDEESNTMTGGHCGSCSPSLATSEDGVVMAPARLAGEGACLTSCMAPGPVTLATLVGRKGTYRACVLEGEAVPTSLIFPGAIVKVWFNIPVHALAAAIDRDGLGHHWVVGRGSCKDVVSSLLSSLGVRLVDARP